MSSFKDRLRAKKLANQIKSEKQVDGNENNRQRKFDATNFRSRLANMKKDPGETINKMQKLLARKPPPNNLQKLVLRHSMEAKKTKIEEPNIEMPIKVTVPERPAKMHFEDLQKQESKPPIIQHPKPPIVEENPPEPKENSFREYTQSI